METLSKTCTKCLRDLPIDQYGKQSSNPDGLKYECKECGRKYLAEWRAKNADRVQAQYLNRQARMTEEEKARKRALDFERYHAAPEVARDKLLRRKYGINLTEYDAMLAAQDGVCAICGTAPGERILHVDHHHDTGAVRGLLCSNCNMALGLFRDSPEFLAQAITYLLNT